MTTTWPPCSICGHETGLSARDSCAHTCPTCEGTRRELDGSPCVDCGGSGLRRQYQESNGVAS